MGEKLGRSRPCQLGWKQTHVREAIDEGPQAEDHESIQRIRKAKKRSFKKEGSAHMAFPDPWADPKSRSPCGSRIYTIGAQNWGIYFWDPPRALGFSIWQVVPAPHGHPSKARR